MQPEPSPTEKEQLSTSEEHILKQIENLLLDEPKDPQPTRGRKSLPDLSGRSSSGGLWGRKQESVPDIRPSITDIWRRSSKTTCDIWQKSSSQSESANQCETADVTKVSCLW